MSSAEDAIDYYKKRFRIETFFSDQKSRGFNIHKSHLTDPQRLSRLLIASCLAYIWLVYLGALGVPAVTEQICAAAHICSVTAGTPISSPGTSCQACYNRSFYTKILIFWGLH